MDGKELGKPASRLYAVIGLGIAAAMGFIFATRVSILSTSRPAPSPNFIENGDFEEYNPKSRPRLWTLDPDALFLWDEFSRGPGGRSLFLDASQIRENAVLRHPLPGLRPGASYLLSFWVARDRHIEGLYPTVALGGRSFRLSDFWSPGRWQKISLIVTLPRILPPDQSRLEFLIPAGDYRFWLDDLVLRRIKPEARLVREPPEKKPALTWAIPSTDRLLDIRLILSRDPGGRTDVHELWTNNIAGDLGALPPPTWAPVEKAIFDPVQTTQRPADEQRIDPSAEGVDRFKIRLGALSSALPHGRWHARVEVYQYRTLLAVSNILSFNVSKRVASAPQTTETSPLPLPSPSPLLDSFPIGVYGAQPDDFASLRDAGFDAVVFSPRDATALTRGFSEAARLGLRLLLPPSAGELIQKAQVSLPAPPAAAPLFFYLADEPEGRSLSPKLVAQSRAALRRLGFPQPGAIALCRSWRARDYASAVDIFMADPYPVPFEPLSWLSECLDEIGRTIADDPAKRVWAVIQSFGWNVHAEIAKTGLGRPPTPAELKTLTRLALLHGADGLFYYTLQSGDYRLRENKPLWAAVKEAIAEARRLKPLLDMPDFFPSPGLPPLLECSSLDAYGLPAIHFAVKRPPAASAPVILVLNTIDGPVQAALRLPGRSEPILLSLGPLEFKIIEMT